MTAVRDIEAICVACALDLQQVHGEAIRTLENEAIKEDGWAHKSFPWACGVATGPAPQSP